MTKTLIMTFLFVTGGTVGYYNVVKPLFADASSTVSDVADEVGSSAAAVESSGKKAIDAVQRSPLGAQLLESWREKHPTPFFQ